jgi:glycerol-3-phosphate O-acyltransferase
VNDRPSLLFRIALFFLRIFRRPYLWAKKKWPEYFRERLTPARNLDTSRMLREVNFLHRLFFGRGFDTIRFDKAEIKPLQAAYKKGPVVFLLRNWGQIEYNYFNDLFLQKDLPLVVHNNMVKMSHWMPEKVFWPIVGHKIDRFFESGHWPYNNEIFELTPELAVRRPVLFCLNLPRGMHWMEETAAAAQREIFQDLHAAQRTFPEPIQLVPLHFIYDKHPGRENSLTDILFGERENPGYFRKMILFLRNYKKRAVAKIGEPIDFSAFLSTHSGISEDRLAHHWSSIMQRAFDTEARQVTGPKLKSRKDFIHDVLENSKLRQKVRAFADAHEMSFETAEKKVQGFLWEISSDIRFTMMELWNYFLNWLFNSLYGGIRVDEEGILKVKKAAKDSPLVLVPCHRSHLDYMLLSYVFYHRDMSLPLVCSGNNLNFWPMGPIFRRSGAYFIRRTLEGDDLYPLALKGYVGELLREGYFQEFFIEGTRSRSGKLFPPKIGLLKMVVESYLEDGPKDVYFVPVSLNYERVLEVKSYLKEIKGGKKQKEKFTDLFRLPRFLKRRYGRIYLQIGEPISLAAALQNRPSLAAGDREPMIDFSISLARKIMASIDEVTTLLPTGLVATVLLSPMRRSFTYEEIQSRYEELGALARAGQARLSESLGKNPIFALEEVLEQFVNEGLLQAHEDLGERFYTLREDIRAHLDYFKNTVIHFFAPMALKRLCEETAARHPRKKADQLWEETVTLLSREFFFEKEKVPDVLGVPAWLPTILFPILESYWLTLQTLERSPAEKIDEKALIRQVMETGETLHLRGLVVYPESLSQFTVQNAVHAYLEMGLLRDHSAELGKAGKKVLSLGDKRKLDRVEKLLNLLLDR